MISLDYQHVVLRFFNPPIAHMSKAVETPVPENYVNKT